VPGKISLLEIWPWVLVDTIPFSGTLVSVPTDFVAVRASAFEVFVAAAFGMLVFIMVAFGMAFGIADFGMVALVAVALGVLALGMVDLVGMGFA